MFDRFRSDRAIPEPFHWQRIATKLDHSLYCFLYKSDDPLLFIAGLLVGFLILLCIA